MKRVAVINDISGFGRCSMTAALPVLSVLGTEACPLPTAVLTNQTGYSSFYCDDYTDKMDIYTDRWKKLGKRFDGISTGYLANSAQIEHIERFISEFKDKDTLLLVDPVMADGGEMYATYTKELCEGVKRLAMQADVITPNLTELCILSGNDYGEITAKKDEKDYLDVIADMAKSLLNETLKTVTVTGIHCSENNEEYVYNGVFTREESCYSRSRVFEGSFSGTGDLFAAVVFGELVNDGDIKTAVETATRFIEKSIEATITEEYDVCDGVNFQLCLGMLIDRGVKNNERA